MKTFITFAMACALSLAAHPDARCADNGNATSAKSSYVATDKFAMYMTANNKLQLRFARQSEDARIEILDGTRTLYRNSIDLSNGANQLINLSELAAGSYTIRVSVGKETTTRNVEVGWNTVRSVSLN